MNDELYATGVNARIEALEEANIEVRQEIRTLRSSFTYHINELLEQIERLANMIPQEVFFTESFPDTYKMIQAQLFHNEPNLTRKRGGHHPSEWQLKLGFWTHSDDLRKYPEGTVKPIFLVMRAPDQTTPRSPTSMLASCLDIGAELIGCRTIKGNKQAKGTRLIEAQVAAIFPAASQGRFPARYLCIGCNTWSESIGLTDPYVTPAEIRKKGGPIEKWSRRFD